MITTSDTADILYTAALELGMTVYPDGNVPRGKIAEERVVIHAKQQTPSAKWLKNYIEVNILVPDMPSGDARLQRLGELERLARKTLKGCGTHDGTIYRFEVESTQRLAAEEHECHYVNASVLFQAMNTIEE